MAGINPYLNFAGRTEEAFNFYKTAFGGEFTAVMRFKDMPDGAKLPVEDKSKIMHIALPIGDNILMGTDTLESMGQKLHPGNNVNICVNADSRAHADELFAKLSAGGKVEQPMQDMFWGDYYGMFTDKFGLPWMITHSKEK